MIKNEEYINLLKSMVACVNYGDYYSIKELSNLKLENWIKKEQDIKKEINSIKKFLKNSKNLKTLNTKDLANLMNLYSYYISEKVGEDIISFEEFVELLFN